MKVLVLATGSVSVKLLEKLISEFKTYGSEVRYIMSDKAMILNSKFEWNKNIDNVLSCSSFFDFKNEVDLYHSDNKSVVHVDLAHWADVVLVAPATANTIAKMHYGICDNVIMDTLLVASGLKKKIVVAPAMNTSMWESWQNKRNIAILKDNGVEFVYPTVKKLACGDYGIGGLADVKAIVDRTLGRRWKFPLDGYYGNRFIPVWPHLGAFGAVRKYEVHNGVDIYCEGEVDVFAIEDGEVVEMGQFTGAEVASPWWNDTWYMTVKGRSGYIVYGEVVPYRDMEIGKNVKSGDKIAFVTPVLKDGKVRMDIQGHSQFMLHIELKRELVHDGGWPLGTERPKELLDPTAYLI